MPEYTRTMNEEYNRVANIIQDDESDFFGESDLLLALWKRKEEWRSFGEGLSELMTMTGYTGGQDVDEKTAYIISAMNSIGVNPAKSTVKAWFSGKRSPDVSDERSRKKMFQLCFALHADKKQSEWFLNNVYLARGFDYHCPEELVYEFCISRGLPYNEAEEMRGQIDLTAVAECSQDKYTRDIVDETRNFTEKSQLVDYINANAADFVKWNKSSRCEIKRLMKELQNEECREKDEKVRETLRQGKKVTEQDTKECSLLIRWIIKRNQFVPDYRILYKDFFASENNKKKGANDSGHETANEDQSKDGKDCYGVQLYSTDFLLKTILGTTEGIEKKSGNNVDIPKEVTDSFPTKKNFSDILDDSKKVSYITVRKALIFIKFVNFWCSQTVEPNKEYTKEELCRVFRDEAKNLLENCGYSGLYVGNPYDWLFLYCSLDESPLDCLHNVITDVRNDQPIDKKGK